MASSEPVVIAQQILYVRARIPDGPCLSKTNAVHIHATRFRLRGFLPTFVRRTAHPDTPGPADPAFPWCPVIASGSGDRGSAGRRGVDRRPLRVVSRDPPRSRRVSLDGHAGRRLPERASINASRSVCVTGTRAGGDQRAITLRWARPALAGAPNEPRNWRSTRYGSPREPIAACNHRWLTRRAAAYELLRVCVGALRSTRVHDTRLAREAPRAERSAPVGGGFVRAGDVFIAEAPCP
ncbi:hypothetical protein HPB50_015430 [Hyalomma asiaticum]|uniref:Uncharacterized protein n=1 Tax=Hyalomma asiaticum TaxID=266040 RepID=A0ACB7TJ51_HYAAI|nr:hypothetical protein HPB50_015430 [Hyalomma asiaticum]